MGTCIELWSLLCVPLCLQWQASRWWRMSLLATMLPSWHMGRLVVARRKPGHPAPYCGLSRSHPLVPCESSSAHWACCYAWRPLQIPPRQGSHSHTHAFPASTAGPYVRAHCRYTMTGDGSNEGIVQACFRELFHSLDALAKVRAHLTPHCHTRVVLLHSCAPLLSLKHGVAAALT